MWGMLYLACSDWVFILFHSQDVELLYLLTYCNLLHTYPGQVTVNLESIPETLDVRQEYALDETQVYYIAHY